MQSVSPQPDKATRPAESSTPSKISEKGDEEVLSLAFEKVERCLRLLCGAKGQLKAMSEMEESLRQDRDEILKRMNFGSGRAK